MPEAGKSDIPHIPVLRTEVIEALQPLAGARILDGTFGAGGYSRALLQQGAQVIALDRDPGVRPFVDALKAEFPNQFSFVAGEFSALDEHSGGLPVDGVVLDIGVSSMQLDIAERGFSFMRDGPLDMRMSGKGTSAADLVNSLEEGDLADLLFQLGEERKSRRIAHRIVAARAQSPITTTAALAKVIEQAIGRKPGDIHPATRSFQALRIAVNDEFGQLVEGLFAAERLLTEGGRLAVVTFHSLEDRIAKRFFNPEAGEAVQSRYMPARPKAEPTWSPVRKAVKAGEAELKANPRARSATLRSGIRTAAAPRPVSRAGLGVPDFGAVA